MWSGGVQREIPFGFTVDVSYVGRRGLYLPRERNINQLPAGTLQANPGVNIAALRPYLGYGAIRLSENAGRSIFHSMQLSVDRRYSNGLKVGGAYTLSKSEDNGSDKRNVLWNTYDDSIYWGPSNYDRRHVLVIHYIYDLPFFRDQSGLWATSWAAGRSRAPRSSARARRSRSARPARTSPGVGDVGFGQPWDLVGDPNAGANRQFSRGSANDDNFWFNPAAFARPANGTFGNAPRNAIRNPGEQQWDLAIFKNFNMGGTGGCRSVASSSTSRTTRTWAASVQPDERQLRPRHRQERPARHPAERAGPVLTFGVRHLWPASLPWGRPFVVCARRSTQRQAGKPGSSKPASSSGKLITLNVRDPLAACRLQLHLIPACIAFPTLLTLHPRPADRFPLALALPDPHPRIPGVRVAGGRTEVRPCGRLQSSRAPLHPAVVRRRTRGRSALRPAARGVHGGSQRARRAAEEGRARRRERAREGADAADHLRVGGEPGVLARARRLRPAPCAGDALRDVQQRMLTGRQGDLREVMRERQDAARAVVERAMRFLRESGNAATDATRQRAAVTVDALAAYGSAAQGYTHGRLERDLDPPGLEALSFLSGAAGVPARRVAHAAAHRARLRRPPNLRLVHGGAGKARATERPEDPKTREGARRRRARRARAPRSRAPRTREAAAGRHRGRRPRARGRRAGARARVQAEREAAASHHEQQRNTEALRRQLARAEERLEAPRPTSRQPATTRERAEQALDGSPRHEGAREGLLERRANAARASASALSASSAPGCASREERLEVREVPLVA
jgi:hypothetical protein